MCKLSVLGRRRRRLYAGDALFSVLVLLAACADHAPSDQALEQKVLKILSDHPEIVLAEQQVLDIVRKHPEVVLESVSAYQQQERQQRAEAEALALKQKVAEIDTAELVGNSPAMGAPERRLVLIEFSDFQCPYCGKAHATVRRFMDQHQAEVTLVYKHLPLIEIHPEAANAARAAWAAQQQSKFWEYHDALFEGQDKLGDEYYLAIAKHLELDIERFNRDRLSEAAGNAVNEDVALALRLGINSTPLFLLNGIPIAGSVPIAEFDKTLAAAKEARAR